MSVVIKFGKRHKGKKVEDCPSDYLQWLVENLDPEDPNWGKQNKLLIDASQNVLTARAQGLLKTPKKPVAAPRSQTSIEASDLAGGSQKPLNHDKSLREDLEIANQALQRIAFALEQRDSKNDEQPY